MRIEQLALAKMGKRNGGKNGMTEICDMGKKELGQTEGIRVQMHRNRNAECRHRDMGTKTVSKSRVKQQAETIVAINDAGRMGQNRLHGSLMDFIQNDVTKALQMLGVVNQPQQGSFEQQLLINRLMNTN